MDSGSFGKQYKGEDIISRMPDDVLSHIISRLEAKDAIKTCVLSTRWKNVWTLIYNLCFRDGYGGNRVTLFVDFVEFVLHHCQYNNIQNFHLRTCYELQESDAARLTELICFVVERNVCSLTLKFIVEGDYPMIRLPQSILTCKSLVKLSLGFWDFVLDIPDGAVCFPCLKFLSFHVYCPNSNLMQKLFRSCPILEELKIKGLYGWDGNVWTFDINKPTLKKLKIDLRATVFFGYALLVEFLHNSPNLEVLVLVKEPAGSYNWDQIVWFELECVPSCMLFHLKEIYLFLAEDRNLQDLEVIKCLLENSQVLERFSVDIYLNLEEPAEELQNEILNFPRASPICQIDFFADHYWGKLWSKFHCWGKLWSEFLSRFTTQP